MNTPGSASSALVLDHVFVMAGPGAVLADHLVELGFVEGSPNVHPGQGTANRRFFFRNVMLEFLWVADLMEVRSPLTRPTKLWERWHGRADPEVSPFGVCARALAGADALEELGFPYWSYEPVYLPVGWSLLFGDCDALAEPCWFVIDPPRGLSIVTDEPMDHPAGARLLTSLSVSASVTRWSTCARGFQGQKLLEMEQGPPLMILEFDERRRGRSCDLRPAAPLLIRW